MTRPARLASERCSRCGHGFLNADEPDDDWMIEFYPEKPDDFYL